MNISFFSLKALSLIIIVMAFSANSSEVSKVADSDKSIGIYYLHENESTLTSNSTLQFPFKLKQQLSNSYPNIKVNVFNLYKTLPFEIDEILIKNRDYAITIGEDVLLKILASRSGVPIFSLKAPKITLDRMRNIYTKLNIELSGIYREQPFEKQLLLADTINFESRNIYLLLGRMSRYQLNDYSQLSSNHNYNLKFQILQNQDSPVTYFEKMQPVDGFLLLLDNPQQFQEESVELLLTSSFPRNIPMIGNQLVHGKIGALAAIYSSDDELIKASDNSYKRFLMNDKLDLPYFLQNWSIMVNQQLAQNFGLNSLNESNLKNIIESKRQITKAKTK